MTLTFSITQLIWLIHFGSFLTSWTILQVLLSQASPSILGKVARSLLATSGVSVELAGIRSEAQPTCPCDPEVTSPHAGNTLVIWVKFYGKSGCHHRVFAFIPEHCPGILSMMVSLPSHNGSDISMSLHVEGISLFWGGKFSMLAI